MGWLCDRVVNAGHTAIADFIYPTVETRQAFGSAFIIWVDRITAGRFEDTNQLFTQPESYNIRVTENGAASEWSDRIAQELLVCFPETMPS